MLDAKTPAGVRRSAIGQHVIPLHWKRRIVSGPRPGFPTSAWRSPAHLALHVHRIAVRRWRRSAGRCRPGSGTKTSRQPTASTGTCCSRAGGARSGAAGGWRCASQPRTSSDTGHRPGAREKAEIALTDNGRGSAAASVRRRHARDVDRDRHYVGRGMSSGSGESHQLMTPAAVLAAKSRLKRQEKADESGWPVWALRRPLRKRCGFCRPFGDGETRT